MTDVLVMALSVAAVLALAYGGLWLLRRTLRTTGRVPDIEFQSSVPLGPRERIVLVRWRDRDLVLGVADGAVTLLAEAEHLPRVEPASGASETPMNLAAWLSRTKRTRALEELRQSAPI